MYQYLNADVFGRTTDIYGRPLSPLTSPQNTLAPSLPLIGSFFPQGLQQGYQTVTPVQAQQAWAHAQAQQALAQAQQAQAQAHQAWFAGTVPFAGVHPATLAAFTGGFSAPFGWNTPAGAAIPQTLAYPYSRLGFTAGYPAGFSPSTGIPMGGGFAPQAFFGGC